MLRFNTEVLIHFGYTVDTAEDGAAAWKKLNSDRYDLLITDQNMPKLTGVELIKKVRAARMALPVIIATGILPKEEFTRDPWAQPEATLLKPYTIAKLLETVREVLSGATELVTAGARDFAHTFAPGGQNAPPNWQGLPTADRLQL